VSTSVKSLTIRFLVYGLTAALVVPLVAIVVMLASAWHEAIRRDATSTVTRIADRAADTVQAIVREGQIKLELLAARPEIRALDPESCGTSLRLLHGVDPTAANMTLIDPSGEIVCSAAALPPGRVPNAAGLEWFIRTMAENRFIVSRPHVGRITGNRVTVLAHPVRDSTGSPVAVLTLPIALSRVELIDNLANHPEGTWLAIVERDGTVTADVPNQARLGHNLAGDEVIDGFLRDSAGGKTGAALVGPKFVSAFRLVSGTGWLAVTSMPTDSVFSDVRDRTRAVAVSAALVLVLVLALSFVIVRRITRPIERLATTAQAVLDGDLTMRMPEQLPTEFSTAAQAFNRMLDVRLQSERRFRDVLEGAPDAMLIVDAEGRIRQANMQAERLFGYARSGMEGQIIEMLLPERNRRPHSTLRREFFRNPTTRPMGKPLEIAARRNDGTEIPVEISLSPLQTPEGVLVLAAVRDVTERKRAQERILKLSRLYLALSRTRRTIAHAVDRQSLLDEVCAIAVETGHLALAWIGFRDPTTDRVKPEAWAGTAAHYLDHLVVSASAEVPEGRGPSGFALREDRTAILSDLLTDPGFAPWRDLARSYGLRSIAAIPLRIDGTPRGVLVLYANELDFFGDPEFVQVLTEMADDLSLALDGLQRDAAHREIEQRFRQLAENIREVFWLTDLAKGEMLYISPAYQDIWARNTEELLYRSPRNWLDAIHPADRERVAMAAMTRQASGTYDEEYRIVRPDGTERWIRDRAFPVRDAKGAVYRVVGIAEDITERKRIQAEATEARRQLEDVLTSISDSCFVVDRAYRFTYLNPQAEALLKRSRSELLGRVVWDEFKEARGTPFETNADRAMHGGEVVHFELHYPPLESWFEVHIYPSKTGLSVFFRDVTERRASEARRQELEEQLTQSQKMEAVGRLTGGIAHDFNNLLTVILLNLKAVEAAVADTPGAREQLGSALSAARRGAGVIRRLLAFSRRQPLEPVAVDVNRLIRDLAPLLQTTLGGTIVLNCRYDDDAGTVMVDPGQLENTIVNLAINARDAMPGGGYLSITTSNVTIGADEAARRADFSAGEYVRIAVADTGTGMSPEVIARAFDPFFTTKGVGKGTGLGLSMVYGFVQQSGGHCSIDSSVGRGTTIEIHLPRSGDAKSSTNTSAGSENLRHGLSDAVT